MYVCSRVSWTLLTVYQAEERSRIISKLLRNNAELRDLSSDGDTLCAWTNQECETGKLNVHHFHGTWEAGKYSLNHRSIQ